MLKAAVSAAKKKRPWSAPLGQSAEHTLTRTESAPSKGRPRSATLEPRETLQRADRSNRIPAEPGSFTNKSLSSPELNEGMQSKCSTTAPLMDRSQWYAPPTPVCLFNAQWWLPCSAA